MAALKLYLKQGFPRPPTQIEPQNKAHIKNKYVHIKYLNGTAITVASHIVI
jgi:hypothetical protein